LLPFLKTRFAFLLRWFLNLFVIFNHIYHSFPLHLMWSIVSWYFLIKVSWFRIYIILFPRFTFWIIHLQLLPYLHKLCCDVCLIPIASTIDLVASSSTLGIKNRLGLITLANIISLFGWLGFIVWMLPTLELTLGV